MSTTSVLVFDAFAAKLLIFVFFCVTAQFFFGMVWYGMV